MNDSNDALLMRMQHKCSRDIRLPRTSMGKRIGNFDVIESFRNVFNILIIFCMLFEFPVIGAMTSRKLALVFCLVYLIISRDKVSNILNNIKRNYSIAVTLLTCCSLISLFNSSYLRLSSNVYIEPYYYINVALYLIIFPLYITVTIKSMKKFAKMYIFIMIIESIIIYTSVVDRSFRTYVYDNLFIDDNRLETGIYWGTRVVGLYLGHSSGSIVLAIGCALLVYLRLERSIGITVFLVFYTILMGATFCVGRLGALLEIAFLISCVFLERRMNAKISIIMISIVAIVIAIATIEMLMDYGIVGRNLVVWATAFFNSETRFDTFDTLASMSIPPFSAQMIFGTNVNLGILPDGSIMNHDSGYIKTYSEIGVVGFVLYYMALSLLFAAWRRGDNDRKDAFLTILVVTAFLIEIKEPYFMKYDFAMTILAMLALNWISDNSSKNI